MLQTMKWLAICSCLSCSSRRPDGVDVHGPQWIVCYAQIYTTENTCKLVFFIAYNGYRRKANVD